MVDTEFFQGRANDKLVTEFPLLAVATRLELEGDESDLRRQVLERGRERFAIFCAPCHGLLGDGQGMVVRRGFPAPPSYHIERLREAPLGHFFDVATFGFGRMFPYRDQVPTADRWAIVAYIRALQLSQHASEGDLSETDRLELARVGEKELEPPRHQEHQED